MKLGKVYIVLFLFIFASIPPNALMVYPGIKLACNVIQILGFIYIFAFLLQRRIINSLLLLFLVFDLSLLLSTVLGNGQVYKCLSEIFNNLGLPILMVSGVVCYKKVIKTAYYYFNLLCSINLLTLLVGVFLQGHTADESVFIIDANGITIYFVLAFALAVVNQEVCGTESNKSVAWLGLVCSVSEILIWSGTGMIAWFAFLGLYIMSQIGRKRRIPYFIGNIATNISSIVLLTAGLSPIFQEFLDFLGKEITLTGRTFIWASAFKKIHASPIMGYGYGEPAFNHYVAHNQILELLVNGGVVLLMIFYAIYIYIGIQEHRFSNAYPVNRSVSVLKAALIGIGIDMMTEIEPMTLIFFVFCILYYLISNVNEGELYGEYN